MTNFNVFAFALFIGIVVLTLLVTFWAAKRTKTTSEFYTAGSTITGWQNGIAITGDFLSASAFLGLIGLISLYGYDGYLYAIGAFLGLVFLLFLVAEPLRNTGKITMADVLVNRLNEKPIRSMSALSNIVISTFYLIAQLVGAGGLIALLLGINYNYAIIGVGLLMILYVIFGGMLATTWVQIIKAFLLMGGTAALLIMVLSKFNFNIGEVFKSASNMYGDSIMGPGLLYNNPIDFISLMLALVLGTAALPHLLIRFYTVPNAKEARKSVVYSMCIIGAFFLVIPVLALGSAVLVGQEKIISVDKGGNMAGPLLAQAVGGDYMFAIIAAVAFATILAVVAGLVITASSAFAHDFYTNVVRSGKATEKEQMRVARISSFMIGILAIILGMAAKDLNISFMSALAFAVGASTNLPVILFTLFWKKFTTTGALAGMIVGLVSSLILTFIGPTGMEEHAIFPLKNPGIISIPLGFIAAIAGSLVSRDHKANSNYTETYVRANTGFDIKK
ncbi:cation acetate symporter [Peribacillus frigoritolerans]|uniref:solute symporter family protein n=1 Tax=Peribacillus frigoritolerans TaxID=450367 RepID=UPI0021D2C6FE|nr:cation acetate symporter [Peribacillus frigoritolerans]MCU6598944.1 cation acetate symporter [Peribacillus frigoritolerans]